MVTCRSPSDSFYLCQILQNVYIQTKRIRIRWYSVVGEDGDDTTISINTHFKLAYTDTLDPHTILTSISDVIDHNDGTISLKKRDIVETKRLLEKSIRGESISSDDMMDLSTEHSHTKKIAKHIHFDSDDESDSSTTASQSSTTSPKIKKRKITSDKKKSRKQPPKKRARKASDSSADTVRKFNFLSKSIKKTKLLLIS